MGWREVERFEAVGRGVMGLLRLWKCVGSPKTQVQNDEPGAPSVSF
jgi:hypothetical protein